MTDALDINLSYRLYASESELDEEWQTLLKVAKDSGKNAYAPYSEYQVGAAVLMNSGDIVTGCNQENAAYPSGLCAERVAFFAASAKYPKQVIKRIAVIAKRSDKKGFSFGAPCGSCRQVMLEYEIRQKKPIELLMIFKDNKFLVSKSIGDLMPLGFTKFNLK